MITEQKKLESRFEELVALQHVLRHQPNKTKLMENQVWMMKNAGVRAMFVAAIGTRWRGQMRGRRARVQHPCSGACAVWLWCLRAPQGYQTQGALTQPPYITERATKSS